MTIVTQLKKETLNPSGGKVVVRKSTCLQRIAEDFVRMENVLQLSEQGYTMSRAVKEGLCTRDEWNKYILPGRMSMSLMGYKQAEGYCKIKDEVVC